MSINFRKTFEKKPSGAIFVSGNGSNAEKLLDNCKRRKDPVWIPKVIVTDRPGQCRAGLIAKEYGLPVLEHDIFKFYQSYGRSSIGMADEEGAAIHDLWTAELWKKLEAYSVDFGILAGFIPLTNITKFFPCLNVHPGDLTVEENGVRIFAGLHRKPVERAILSGRTTLRSSVIIAQPVSRGGKEADDGPVLGVSVPIPVELCGFSLEELKEANSLRQGKTREQYRSDPLDVVTDINLTNLKVKGDWVIFSQVVDDFASGRFSQEDHDLLYNGRKILTVEYSEKHPPHPVERF